MKVFVAALMFLTRIPLPKIRVSKQEWIKSTVYFPLIGLMIGGILFLAILGIEKLFSFSITAFLIVLLWIWITGGLHIDGWMDLADGFGSNRSREETLEIMKDSRVGAMGVIAAICLIAGKIAAVEELIRLNLPIMILLSPLYSRFFLIGAIKFWPYRSEGGIGEGLSTYLSMPVMLLNLVVIVIYTYWLTGVYGLLLFFITAILTGIFILKIYQKLKMLTGDCYGAIVEFSECLCLFLALAVWRFVG